jgi:hypothetical protein
VRGAEDCNRNHYESQSQSQIGQSADGLGRANEGVSSIAEYSVESFRNP